VDRVVLSERNFLKREVLLDTFHNLLPALAFDQVKRKINVLKISVKRKGMDKEVDDPVAYQFIPRNVKLLELVVLLY
jgi:hypothetical protein